MLATVWIRPAALTVPVVLMLPPVMLPVAVTPEPVVTLNADTVPDVLIAPPVLMLPPVTLPVTLRIARVPTDVNELLTMLELSVLPVS